MNIHTYMYTAKAHTNHVHLPPHMDPSVLLLRQTMYAHLFEIYCGAVVAERLRPLTSIPEVPGSNPGPAVVCKVI